MNGKRIVSAALALLLTAGIPMAALAEEYDLANGNITVSADNSGQYVSQKGGVTNEKQTTETVIKQADNTAATGNTITVETSGGAKAELTIEDLNVRSGNTSAIDVKGSSEAEITLKGDNKLETEDASVIHVSEGHVTITGDGTLYADNSIHSDHAKIGSNHSEDMSGSIHITGNAQVTTGDDRHDDGSGDGAAIGSGWEGNMSGDIVIDENANVTVSSSQCGAGIGSGEDGEISSTGNITITDNAEVVSTSGYDGAGIGSGEEGEMSGNITIDGNAKVTAWSEKQGAGIGAGEEGGISGTIWIGGNASVKAGSACDGAGIGGGGDEDGHILEGGKIIICGNAEVIAIGEDLGCGIGGGEDAEMRGMILICDNANVTAIGGDRAAAIGTDAADDVSGSILILGNASVTTGVEDGIYFDYDTKQIIYTLDESAVGIIGGGQSNGQSNRHDSTDGFYILSPDAAINGLKGSDTESLKQYINLFLSGENHDGEPENLTMLAVRQENGVYTVEASGQGTLERVLYNGSSQAPSAPGRYTVKCVLRLSQNKTIDFEFELIIPDSASKEASEAARTEALFRVTDADGRDIPYTQAREGSTLTIAAEQNFAILTGTLHGIAVLQAQGVEKIFFKTNGASSSFQPEQLLAEGRISDRYTLTHDGSTVTFLLGQQKTDIQKLLG